MIVAVLTGESAEAATTEYPFAFAAFGQLSGSLGNG